MSKAVFKYPGGKTQLANWILEDLPAHRTWVEVFGGSGVVTANKDPSKVEVYNDIDGDLVHFFTTLRDRAGELQEWLRQTPHSRELHREYAHDFYDGVRPDDDIARAGRFFFLRFTQWGTKYESFSGYNGGKKRSAAKSYNQATNRLTRWQERFNEVQIEQLDCVDLIERYDSPETCFYADPPYMDEGDDLYSHEGAFDHGALVDALLNAEGYWIVSYTRIPEPLQEAATVVKSQDRHVRMRQGQDDWEKTNTENLVLNYDPAQTPMFRESQQNGLNVYE